MFEIKVIDVLGFITNKLDIKSSTGKKYASYNAIVTIEGTDYNIKLHGDNEIFNGRVIKSSDNKHMISSYDGTVKIAKDESKVKTLDINTIEIEKKVRISNGIFWIFRCTQYFWKLLLNGIVLKMIFQSGLKFRGEVFFVNCNLLGLVFY